MPPGRRGATAGGRYSPSGWTRRPRRFAMAADEHSHPRRDAPDAPDDASTATAVGPPATGLLVIHGGDVVTMNDAREVLVGGAVAIDGDTIVAVGGTADLLARFPDAARFDAAGTVVTPGLVDAHQHLTADPLVRCCIPDRIDSATAIGEWAVPLHAALRPVDDELAATLAAVEAVSNGVTTIVEAGTIAHHEAVAVALRTVGVRATLGVWGWDVGDGPHVAPVADVLDRQRAVVEAYRDDPLLDGWVTLVGHDLATDELLGGAADLARDLGTSMTMHLSPTSADVASYVARTGHRPVRHLAELGVLGSELLLAHAVWIDDEEVELLLSSGTAVAACPWAYLRLGQGVSRHGRHGELVRRGGRVALGCDSGNAGDAIDVLRAAAAFVGLARDADCDPLALGADTAFALATIDGARAIGMGDRIGSLEAGKRADVVVHRTDTPAWTPRGDTALQLVWGTDGRTVRDVWVAGRRVLADGRVTTVDVDAVAAVAADRRRALLAETGLTPMPVWPHLDGR